MRMCRIRGGTALTAPSIPYGIEGVFCIERVTMNNCVFCRIIHNEIPSMKVYEDPHSLVIMDAAQDVDGHMLAIPKKHVESVLDCDTETLHSLMDAVKRVSEHCVTACGYDGVNLLNASGEAAGQSVPHFHIHIIPRKHQDQIDAWPDFPGAQNSAEEIFQGLMITK